MTRQLRRAVLATAIAIVALLTVGLSSALAAWSASAIGIGAAAAGNMPDGPVPTATPAGTGVTVSWDAVSLIGGSSADYVVRRYDLSDNGTNPNTGCNTVISASSCTEQSVPEGRWKYTVATAKGSWRGAEGAKSSPDVHVATRVPSNLIGATMSRTNVSLAWNDNSSVEDGYRIQRSDTGTDGWTDLGTVLASGATSTTDATLTCGVTKHYRVKATSAANGDSEYSDVASATAAACPQAQATPTNLTATATSATQIDLAWTDNAASETGYLVETSSDGSAWTPVNPTLPAGSQSYSDTTLQCGTTRYYRVKALGDADSNYSNTANATTNACLVAPTAPIALNATVVSGTRIDLSWTDTASNETKFEIRRVAGSVTSLIEAPANTGAGSVSYTDTVLCGTQYTYDVRAVNAAGESLYSNAVTSTSTACVPAAPTNLTTTGATATSVSLSWTDNANNETGFDIERTGGTGGTVVLTRPAASTNPTTYTDPSAICGTSYTYKVRATNAGGSSDYTTGVTTSTTVCAPAAPTNLAATGSGGKQIDLAWTHNSTNTTGFRVLSSTTSNGTYTLLATLPAGTTSYSHKALSCNTTRYYQVQAANGALISASSNTASATTRACTTYFISAVTGTGATTGGGKNPTTWQATASIVVQNHNGAGQNGIVVTGHWSNAPATDVECTTSGGGGNAGKCNVLSASTLSRTGTTEVTFTVTSVAPAASYDALSSVDDSVTVTAP